MPPLNHLTLTVTDPARSAEWYQALLSEATIIEREGPTWQRKRLQWPDGLVLGFTRHRETPESDHFDHARVGLDHIGLGCASEAEVRSWADRMSALGVEHGPVEDVPYGWAVTARDPDGIAVEFFCLRG
ncbi:MAG: VOC family protein [Actinobacteria bacterium]|nr:VOC family protein [Actinomycetota bacterium]